MSKRVGGWGLFIFLLQNICRFSLQLNPIKKKTNNNNKKDLKLKWKWVTYKCKYWSDARGFLFKASAAFLGINGSLEKHIPMFIKSNKQATVDRLVLSYIKKKQRLVSFTDWYQPLWEETVLSAKAKTCRGSTLGRHTSFSGCSLAMQHHPQIGQHHHSCNCSQWSAMI